MCGDFTICATNNKYITGAETAKAAFRKDTLPKGHIQNTTPS